MPNLAHQLFIKLFFSPLHYAVPDKERKAASFAEKFSLTAAGKRIQCYKWGNSNKTILFVHGWGGRATQFRRFIKPLMKAGFQIVGFDGPAHGHSSGKRTNLMEFEEVIRKIYGRIGTPEAIITHSFGGGAVLFSAMKGLVVSKLITIACPSIGDEIINTYLKALNASPETGKIFKQYILQTYRQPFDTFTALHFIKHLTYKMDWLLIHDENDREVSIDHARAILSVYPWARLYQTKQLGHTRILKNDTVIRFCVTYITNQPSLESANDLN